MNYSLDVPVSQITNGVFQLADSYEPPATDIYSGTYGRPDYWMYCKSVDGDGNESGSEIFDSRLWNYDEYNWGQPFYDARAQMKQNLIFQLRNAPVDTILFGTRHLDVTERHEGMVLAVALDGRHRVV